MKFHHRTYPRIFIESFDISCKNLNIKKYNAIRKAYCRGVSGASIKNTAISDFVLEVSSHKYYPVSPFSSADQVSKSLMKLVDFPVVVYNIVAQGKWL